MTRRALTRPGAAARVRAGFVAAAIVATQLSAVPARAEFPALTRPLVLGPPALLHAPLEQPPNAMRLSGEVWLGGLSRALEPGDGDPRAEAMELGGRLRVSLARGRWDLSAEATQDTPYNVDSREYPARLSLGRSWPSLLSARATVGYEDGVYDGADLELEPRALPLAGAGARWRPRLVSWLRVRKLDFEREWLATPAVGLTLGESVAGGRGLAFGLSTQWDAAEDDHPSGFGMLTVRWASVGPTSNGEGRDMLGTPFGGQLDRRWFVHAAYAFPLDDHQYARIAVGAGVGFDSPF